MAQQIINTGAVANDGTGESLRDAFNAVNDNFANIWAQGPVDSQVVISNNLVTTNQTNLDLVLAANGIGNVTVNSTLTPGIDSVYDLGASDAQFDTVWARYYQAGSGTFSGDVTVDGNLVVAGNIIQVGNIVTDSLTIQLGNTVTNAAGANGAGITVGANDNIATMLYSSTSNTWTMNIGANVAGNITAPYFIGNGALLTGIVTSNYANANAVAYGQAGWAGNIIPSGNAVYSLGNATNQWNDLYVSNTTIYMNNVPISLTAGNVLTVDGEPVLVNDSNTSITTTGNITADNFFGSGVTAAAANDVVALNAFDTDGNTVSIQAQGNTSQAVIETYFEGANNRFTWSFDNSGTLTFPASQTSIFGGYDNDFTINTSNTGNAVYTFTFSQFGDLSVPVNLDVSGNVYTDNIVGTGFGNVTVTANTQSWLFDNNGTLTLPGNSQILPAGNTGVRLSAGASDTTGLLLDNTGDAEIYANANVTVYTDAGNIGWTFDNTGNLTVPNIIQGSADSDYALKLGAFPEETAAGRWLQVRSGDVADHIHFDTSNNSAWNFYVGSDNQYVLIGNTGNVSIGSYDSSNNATYQWMFDKTGNLAIPGTIVSDSTILFDNRESGNIADIQLYSADDILLQGRDRTVGDDIEGGDINIYAGDGSPDDAGGGTGTGGDIQIIGGVGGAADVSSGGSGGTVRLDAGNGGDGSATAAAGSGATAYVSAGDGGVDNGGGGNNGGDVVVTAGDTTDVAQDRGSIILNAGAGGDASSLGGYVQVNIPSVGTNPGGQWTFTGSGTTLETPANAEIFGPNFGNLTVGSAGNTIITSADYGITTYNWVFDNAGGIVAPNLTVTRGDRTGTLTGSTLRIGNGSQEAILTTPNGVDGSDSQRLVINPGAGDGFGEGGDIYLYSGRGGSSGGSGGDIKIRGGLGPADGAGGYLDIMGGEAAGNGVGGRIDILGGQSANSTGGVVRIQGGQGINGAEANLVGGTGSAGSGGGVNIAGGVSSNGLAEYGNVTVTSGASTWTFDNTGNLNLPNNGSINFNAGGITQATDEDFVITVNDADDDGFAIFNRVTDTDGNVVGQTELRRDRLNINLDMLGSNYQWQFSDNQGIMYLPGNISGNYGSDTSFFVTDNGSGGTMEMKTISYIGDTLGSNVRVTQSNATISTSNAAYTWTFDNTGNLTVPGNTIVSTANATGGLGGKNISITAGASDTVTWNSNPGGNVNIAGGYGSFGDGGGGPGGQVNIIGGSSSDSHAGNVTINSGNSTWTFDYTGNLTAPGNISTDWLNISNVGNITSLEADVKLQIVADAGNTAPYWTFNNDGNLFVPGNINGDNSAPLYIDGAGSHEGYISLPSAAFGNEQVVIVNNFSLGNGIRLETNGGNLFFDNAGVLTVPGNIVMPPGTSLTGTGASPAPNISGFTSVSAETLSATGNVVGGNIRTAGLITATGNITTAGNFVGNGAALTNVTVSVAGNIVGTQSNVTLVAGSYSYTFDNTGILTLPAGGGNEGAEINFTKAANSTLSGNSVAIDQYVDRIRFFEGGGNTRGAYIDLTQAADGVGTLLNNRVSGLVNAGTFVTMDLLKATVTTSGNRGLSLAATTGSFNINISGTYGGVGGGSGGASTGTINTTPSTSQFGWNFTSQAEGSTYIITDTTNNRAYRVTLQIGGSFNNNLISIERLI